ncbi:MAG: radical SAM protein [Deltaproteobacteria bacterium]|nr:radical SAM protein [Deltaproteobacteria bacterium]
MGATPRELAREVTATEREHPHPLYVVWEITLRCDLGCKHCGSRAGPSRESELDTEQCLDVVAQLHELGVKEITLIGGEAYLREDWDVIAREITKRGMVCGITSGGRNLDAERVARAVDAGVRTISVSIDGLEATHDAQRGARGAFESAMASAERISNSPMRLATNTQINRLSMPELPALAGMLTELGTKAWQIQLTVPMGRGADRAKLLLQPFELLTLYPILVWIKEQRLDPAGISLFPGNNIGYFGPYESALRFRGDTGAHWGGCPAGKWSLGLEADGKIKACPSLPSTAYTGGLVREARIADVIRTAPEITSIQNRGRDDLWGFCSSCYYAEVCKAGCTWTSHVLLGRPGNNPYCIHRATEHERLGVRERLERLAHAPGTPFDHGAFGLVVEPLPAIIGGPDVCGFPIDRVIGLDWREGTLWSAAEIEEILRQDERRGLPVLSH